MPEWMASAMRAEIPLFFVVLLRLVVGGEFLYGGYQKYQQGYATAIGQKDEQLVNPLLLKLEDWKDQGNMLIWYEKFLDLAVLKNVQIFAILVTVGELVLGAMLVLGLLVRIASVVGFCLCLNYLFATWHLTFPYREFNILILVLLVVFLLAGAGRCLGADAALHERFPEIPLF